MDRKFLPVGITIILSLLCTLPAGAGYRSWTSKGPDGGDITSVAMAGPGTLYAAVFEGVMKSTDNGLTWHWVLTDTFASGPLPLAVDPSAPSTVYAARPAGLYKTVDGGATWNLVKLAIRNVEKIAISPLAPQTVWVGGFGFYVSRDSGESWSAVAGEYPAGGITKTIVLDPTRPGVVYAAHGGSSGGLFKTVDDGRHWTRIHYALPFALALDPVHPWRLYAGGMSTIAGILRSVDGGATWTHLDSAMGDQYVSVLAVDPRTSEIGRASCRERV